MGIPSLRKRDGAAESSKKHSVWLDLSGLLAVNILIALDTTCLATALPVCHHL